MKRRTKYFSKTRFFVLKMLQFKGKAFEIWFRRFISADVVLYLEVPKKKMLTKRNKFCCCKIVENNKMLCENATKILQLFHVNSRMLRFFLFQFFHSGFSSWRVSPWIRMVEWLHVSSHVISNRKWSISLSPNIW